MNNTVFGETMEKVRKYRDIKLVTTSRIINYLLSEPNYHTMIFRGFVTNRNEKAKNKMNKLVYLGLSILDISKTLMHEFRYD